MYLCQYNDTEFPGAFILRCLFDENCSEYLDLRGSTSVKLTWGNRDILYLIENIIGDITNYPIMIRKFSDGYGIQTSVRAFQPNESNRTFTTVTLHEPFKNTGYFVCATSHKKTWHADGDVNKYNKTTSSFDFSCSDGIEYITWFAYGRFE